MVPKKTRIPSQMKASVPMKPMISVSADTQKLE